MIRLCARLISAHGKWPSSTAPRNRTVCAFWETPGDLAAPEGESWNDTRGRVTSAAEALRAAHPGRDIIAVAHMGAILTQVQTALQITAYQAFGHRIDNLSVTALHHDGARWHASGINHLP